MNVMQGLDIRYRRYGKVKLYNASESLTSPRQTPKILRGHATRVAPDVPNESVQ
jgi:hypothetical protein